MSRREKRTRIILAGFYFIVTCGVLFYYTYGDYFCSSSRTGRTHAMVTVRLALACTAWGIFASMCGAGALSATKKYSQWSGTAPLLGTLVAGLGFASRPVWFNEGYGRHIEGTWADVSCFFYRRKWRSLSFRGSSSARYCYSCVRVAHFESTKVQSLIRVENSDCTQTP
jgi:hypothetical protein